MDGSLCDYAGLAEQETLIDCFARIWRSNQLAGREPQKKVLPLSNPSDQLGTEIDGG